MPVLPSEDKAPEGITEKVAKNPSSATESTASGHSGRKWRWSYVLARLYLHSVLDENEHTPGKPSAQDFQSKGPAIPQTKDDMPPAASKEELKAKAKELNQWVVDKLYIHQVREHLSCF